jgi:tRNA-dihydrouridine synthase A
MRAIAFVVSRSKKRSSSPLRRPHSDRRNALRFVSTYEIDLIEERPWRSNMTVDEWPSKKARKMNRIDRRFSVAPMMDWTDRHCRTFHRALTREALLYTEMLTADAVIHGDRTRLLGFSEVEHPLALQLGGSDPAKLRAAAEIGAALGYDEINLNIGCPSDRVQSGRFGACLMREPQLVAQLWSAAQAGAGATPVTIKCRLGVDDQDPRAALFALVDLAAREGCGTFIVHARKAWLSGLSPKENRDVPPLDYALVRELKRARPELEIILNGGLRDLHHAQAESEGLDGVMLERAAYQNPAILLSVDAQVFDRTAANDSRVAAVHAYIPYIEAHLREGVPLHSMTRHMLGLFAAQPGGRLWRRVLSQEGVRRGAGVEVVRAALAEVARAPAEAA